MNPYLILLAAVIAFLMFCMAFYGTRGFHQTRTRNALDTDGTIVRLLKPVDLRKTYHPGSFQTTEEFEAFVESQPKGRIIDVGEMGVVGDNGYYFNGDWVYRFNALVEVVSVPKGKKKKARMSDG